MNGTIRLPAGTLTVHVSRADLPLDALCGFASRRSRKRGFVFVSRVLGKHYPVRPRVMADVHARLAARLAGLPGPVLVIGMAETATGLGQGLYERLDRPDALFIHTTRYRLDRPLALDFEESHSHAPDHLLYVPTDADLFHSAKSLVLIDDELSTGRTLANLATAYRARNVNVAEVHIVRLTDWLADDRRAAVIDRIGVPTSFHSLLTGTFTFTDDPAFDPGPVPAAVGGGDFKDAILPTASPRLGVRGPLAFDAEAVARTLDLKPTDRVLVLGTGEFAHPPFRLALYLETRGHDVHSQTTTRSPLMVGDALMSVVETVDNYHDGIPNYVYNVADRHYDRIVICYETRPLPVAHTLPATLSATPVFL
jgi:adenine/guanine phosphoribosyltransferase-like PRPP-binding protein